jgi:hypothetical protein
MELIAREHKFTAAWDWGVADKVVPYFLLTEYFPSVTFIYAINTLSKVFTREDEIAIEAQR